MSGTLYIIATPIGNLEDITLRAVRILKEVDLIACEDTRHAKKLLNHCEIRTPVTSYFEHNKLTKGDRILAELQAGKNIALISDAGTPGISDPGFNLVRSAVEQGINIISIPGCSAAIAALSASGLPTDRFLFVGFPPQKEGKKKKWIEGFKEEEGTLIIYESPYRVKKTLVLLHTLLGDRAAVLAHELTKIHEGFFRGSLGELSKEDLIDKGEWVILVEGSQK